MRQRVTTRTNQHVIPRMKVVVVVPVYHEASVIYRVVRGIKQQGFALVIVVDDGSVDDTESEARRAGALVIRHTLNRGKGAATRTGMDAALHTGADIIVTMDGDGQHVPHDIQALVDPLLTDHYDVVLGNRFAQRRGIPTYKYWHNMLANFITWVLYRARVSDSQSGFRAYARVAAATIDTKADFYDFESEVLREIIRHRLRYCEVQITARYTSYSQTKRQRQGFTNGLRTMSKMLWNLIR